MNVKQTFLNTPVNLAQRRMQIPGVLRLQLQIVSLSGAQNIFDLMVFQK